MTGRGVSQECAKYPSVESTRPDYRVTGCRGTLTS
jgi:hypothetical protein